MSKRSASVVLILALALAAVLPGAAEARFCSCSFCGPGTLLAPCYWPGYGNVYCVDFWEFQCFSNPNLDGGKAAQDQVCAVEPAELEGAQDGTDGEDPAADETPVTAD